MDRIIINVHSMVDIITNSSTELFVLDTKKAVDVVIDIVKEKEKQWPNEYGHNLSVNLCDLWRIQEVTQHYFESDEEIKNLEMYLNTIGYRLEKTDEVASTKYIEISAERGGLDPRLKSFIETTFNVIHYDFDS